MVMFSDFTDGNECQVGDQVVGLRSSGNYRFDFPGVGIKDVDGNFLFQYGSAGASAVNWMQLNNSATGSDVGITTEGSDASVGFIITPKGSGEITLDASIVNVDTYIVHEGDTDTFIEFGTDTFDFQAGGSSRLDISDSGVRLGAANSRVTTILDEDNMASDSDTALATQQSIKAYVDGAVSGGFAWNEVTGTSASMVAANGYIANNAALVTLTLPATATLGDEMSVVGKGSGLFKIAQNAGQTVHFGGSSTTTGAGGSLTSMAQYDSLRLVCITANTDFALVGAPQGPLTVV